MFAHEFDLELRAVVFLFSGKHNSDEDYAAYLDAIAELDRRAAGLEVIAIQVIDPGNAVPSAAWRKRIADSTAHMKSRPYYIMVTTSAIVRGVMTAINWLRPPPYEFAVASTFDEALLLVNRRRDTPIDQALLIMLDRLRKRSAA